MAPAVAHSQAESLLAFRLLLVGGMFSASTPPPGPLEKVFQYIDLHQDEFVQLSDGQTLPIPPILLAELGSDPKKPTVCFYGHLDVQPARQEDGWLTDPYTLTEVDGKLYGRGTTDNKGPVLAWINAVSAFKALDEDLPVNIKFLIEGMEESGSLALEELVRKEKSGFFSSVDCIVISDNLWISRRKPALIYGTRGNSYFTVEVKCRDQDFHSGTFGGILNEPMADLVALLGSLVDASGRILVPGIYGHVAPVTEEEKRVYEAIDLDVEEYRNSSQVKKFLFDTKERQMFGTEPDMIRDGSTIPIAKILQDTTQKSVIMLPLGAVDDGEHSQNEKINRWNYIEGSKLFAAFFLEMAKLHSSW